jgi:hypothetical protein
MLLALEKKKITAKDDELIDVTKRIGPMLKCFMHYRVEISALRI